MAAKTIVDLPRYVQRPYEVFVNGVQQIEGDHYSAFGSSLIFERSFARAPRLGVWRWIFILTCGIVVGGYEPHDTIDVVCTVNGQRRVTSLTPRAQPEPAAASSPREASGAG